MFADARSCQELWGMFNVPFTGAYDPTLFGDLQHLEPVDPTTDEAEMLDRLGDFERNAVAHWAAKRGCAEVRWRYAPGHTDGRKDSWLTCTRVRDASADPRLPASSGTSAAFATDSAPVPSP